MNLKKFENLFPLGSHLCREPMPTMSEMKKDMENLKKHGFNLIKLQENWAIDEPLEGHYDFSRYEELISHAATLDLGIYFGLTCEQAPTWLWRKYPDARMVGLDGQTIVYEAQTTLPGDGKPGPCYDHPGAMEDQLRFIKKMVSTLGGYENIVVWNTWQEISYWAENFVAQPVCFCENTLSYFRKWLKEKYGDLDGLNKAWNSRYLDWNYVAPDRQVRGKNCLPNDIDWKYFMENIQIGNILKNRAQAIKDTDILKRPVFAHKGSPSIGSGIDWTYARCQDFLGTSVYPAWGPAQAWDDIKPEAGRPYDEHSALLAEMWSSTTLNFDYIRSCNVKGSPIWGAEFQGGPVSTGFQMGRVPTPEDIRRWMLSAVGAGATAISYWVTRAEIMAAEINGFGLLDSEGETSERFEEAARIGKALIKHSDLLAKPSWGGAKAAILINDWNYQLCASLAQGGEHLAYSVRGWHRMLWDAGISVDFIDISELDEKYVKEYKTIILPFPLSISEEVSLKLVKYVEEGGNLISEAGPGRLNEHGFANRGELSPALRELFGVSQKNFKMVREPGYGARWSPPERTFGEYYDEEMILGTGDFINFRLRANIYIQTFVCNGSTPILKFKDTCAGAVRTVGKGKAWLLGTYAGHNGTAYKDKETREFIKELLSQCGIKPENTGELLLRKRVSDYKEAWFFTNASEKKVTEQIDVEGWSRVEDLLGETLEMNKNSINLTVESLDVRVLVLTK